MMLMKRLFYVNFWKEIFIFYLFFVDVPNWNGAPTVLMRSATALHRQTSDMATNGGMGRWFNGLQWPSDSVTLYVGEGHN